MKKSLLTFLTFAAVFQFASCSKQSESSEINEKCEDCEDEKSINKDCGCTKENLDVANFDSEEDRLINENLPKVFTNAENVNKEPMVEILNSTSKEFIFTKGQFDVPEINEVYPRNQLVELEGGEFMMGTDVPVFLDDGESPAREVSIRPFAIDKFEVSNGEFIEFVKETGFKTEVCFLCLSVTEVL